MQIRFGGAFTDTQQFSNFFMLHSFKNIKVEYKDFLLPGIPKIFVKPSIVVGGIAEKMPLIKKISQSIFISAEN